MQHARMTWPPLVFEALLSYNGEHVMNIQVRLQWLTNGRELGKSFKKNFITLADRVNTINTAWEYLADAVDAPLPGQLHPGTIEWLDSCIEFNANFLKVGGQLACFSRSNFHVAESLPIT